MSNALEPATDQPTVLIVDDFAAVRRMLAMQLADCGYRTIEAEGGTDALERINDEHVDLVLTDIGMPGFDGLELVHAVRELSPATPVVVMAGAGALAAVNESSIRPIDAYVDAVCLKPFQAGDVIRVVQELVAA